MGIQDHLTCLLRNLYTGQEATVRTRHGTTDWFQIGKGVCQGCILSPCLFNFYAEYIIQNAGLDEAQTGIRIAGEIAITTDMQMTSSLWQKQRGTRFSWWKWKESEKAGLKLNIQKSKIMASSPIISWQIDGEIMETVTDFIFLGSIIPADVDSSLKIKRCLLLSQSQKAEYCMIPHWYPK